MTSPTQASGGVSIVPISRQMRRGEKTGKKQEIRRKHGTAFRAVSRFLKSVYSSTRRAADPIHDRPFLQIPRTMETRCNNRERLGYSRVSTSKTDPTTWPSPPCPNHTSVFLCPSLPRLGLAGERHPRQDCRRVWHFDRLAASSSLGARGLIAILTRGDTGFFLFLFSISSGRCGCGACLRGRR